MNTPRAQITDFDTTKRSNFNVDYNHAFNAGGFHTLKGGYGFQHDGERHQLVSTRAATSNIFWDSTFTFGGAEPGRGTYGYYEVNDRRITNKAGNNIHSLYIQDQWTVGNRLTLNLGLRTEDEKVPTFRPEFLENAFHFDFGDKLAPRLGAAYDVCGDGRMKVFGSWGLYYDWTKYELPRGSFGAETWCIYYRGLDTLDLGSLNLSNMPGQDLWATPGSCRDRRVPSFGSDIDPDIEPMKQASTSAGVEYQLNRNSVLTVHYIHNDLLRDDRGHRLPQRRGRRGLPDRQPRQAGHGDPVPDRRHAARAADAAAEAPVRRARARLQPPVRQQLVLQRQLHAEPAVRQLRRSGVVRRDHARRRPAARRATAQQQAGSISRPGGNVNRAWDLDELLWDSHGNLDVLGRLATDRPHVVKLYGAYDFPFGTQIGAFFYGAQRHADHHLRDVHQRSPT